MNEPRQEKERRDGRTKGFNGRTHDHDATSMEI